MLMNIMEVSSKELERKYYIDCPVDTIMEGIQPIRMQIPQELAKYIKKLQIENTDLKEEIKELSK